MTRLVFDPWIPWALWMPLAVAAVGLMVTYAFRSRRLLPRGRRSAACLLMSFAVAIPLIVLLNPMWVRELPPPAGKPALTLLVDTSASMATADASKGQSRFAAARTIAEMVESEMSARFDVEIKSFADNLVATSPSTLLNTNPEGTVSDLAMAVQSSLADRPRGQSIWLLSDGVHNGIGGVGRVREAAAQARAMAVPVFTTTIGGPSSVLDLEASLPVPQEMAFVGQEVLVPVTVSQRGLISDKARVLLTLNGEVVDERSVGLVRDAAAETTFRVKQESVGLYRYEVIASPVPNEVTELNNRASLVLRVIDEPVRVLLLEGKPYWDTKFLVRTLALDPSIELHSVVRMTADRFLVRKLSRAKTDNEKKEATQPARDAEWEIARGEPHWLDNSEKLAQFQIVILGRDSETFLSDDAVAELKKWLRQGDGSLVCFRGPPTSRIGERLGEMLPVRWTPQNESRFRVQFTSTGQSLRWFADNEDNETFANLPSLARTAVPDRPRPLAVVLAAAATPTDQSSQPAIIFQPYGGGRVVVVEGAGMWRWAMLPPQEQQNEHVYGQLWRSMTRWLVANVGLLPTQRASLRADKTAFGAFESATATLLVRDPKDFGATPRVQLRGATQEPVLVAAQQVGDTPNQFRIDFGKLKEGRYLITLSGAREDEVAATAAFDVVGNLRERLDVAARPDVMRLLAEESGGAALEGAQARELIMSFDRQLAATLPRRLQQTTAWDRWWVLAGLLCAWATTWTFRRRSGLV